MAIHVPNEDHLSIRFWDRIPVRLGVALLVLTLTGAGVLTLILARQEERRFEQEHVSRAHATSSLIASDLASEMLAGGGPAVWKVVSDEAALAAETVGASRIVVVTKDGVVKAASGPSVSGRPVDVRNSSECPGCDRTRPEDFPASAIVLDSTGARRLRVVNPVRASAGCTQCHQEREGDVRGYVAIDFDMSPLESAATERRWSILTMAAIASTGLVVVLTLLFRWQVMGPVNALIGSMKHLAGGDLSGRATVPGRGELVLMAGHFNNMARQIEDQVARIEAAATESSLLYTLVVEASRNLETAHVAAAVSRVIREKFHPGHEAFFLETADDEWTCATAGEVENATLSGGEGTLESALASDHPRLQGLLDGISPSLIAEVRRTRTLQFQRGSGQLALALPLLSGSRLIGLLACTAIPASVRLNEGLLGNLGAHLTLAAANSRNYTGAITDPLTHLKNKRYGLSRLNEAVNAARRYNTGLALVMCDIDHFKQVNDTYGHPAGDAVLVDVSHRLAASVREADIAVRYGGEEFMLILPEADAGSLQAIGEKLRAAVAARPVDLGTVGGTVSLTLSVGVAAFRSESDTGATLIARADAALYRAKEGGRNRVEVSSS